MGIVTKYKFNQNIYENFIPTFNSDFTDYTITDEIDTDGYTIRTIESDNLPTLIRFGSINTSGNSDFTKQHSLLEVNNLNTSNVTNMSQMFANCSSLTSLDTSNFNTSKTTNMERMFQDCSKLTSLDVSNFDTSQVITMYIMFNGCSSLTSLDVSNFNTEKVTNMSYMFQGCRSLTSLNVSNFNTSNVTTMCAMFDNCPSLTLLDVSNFNTEKVTNMDGMFSNCCSLTSLDVTSFNTEKVTVMDVMFQNCLSLTSLDVSNFNTENVTNMYSMFSHCSSLTSLDVSNFNTEKVTSTNSMFSDCSKLTSLDVSKFETSQVTNMYHMFYNCSSLALLDVSNFNTSKVTTINDMFRNTINLVAIGMIYCNSDTINKISDLITTDTTIWYSDAKLEDLTKKSNITYKEYKMNILESDEEINLRKIGNVYDELNLETGELTQRIGEIILDGSESTWGWIGNDKAYVTGISNIKLNSYMSCIIQCDKYLCDSWNNAIGRNKQLMLGVHNNGNIEVLCGSIYTTLSEWRTHLKSNPITVQYQLATPIIKTINLKGKPSINWQGDTHLHLENNTLYPQLDCEVESVNYYEIPKLKANTLYTLRYVGEPTQCIFGGLTYKTENNMVLTSGSSDNLLYFDKEVRKVILIEGDVRDRNFDYFEGIESLGAVEIITHKSDMPIFAKGGRK